VTRRDYDTLRKTFFQRGGKLRGRLNRRIANRGGQILEKDAEVTITNKGSGLQIEVKTCKHCKQSSYFRGVDFAAVDLMEPIPAQPKKSRPRRHRSATEQVLMEDAEEGDF
jgi:hypothetical protein